MKIRGIFFITVLFFSSCTAATPNPTVQTSTTIVPATPSATLTSTPTAAATPTLTNLPPDPINLEPFATIEIEAANIEFDVNGDGRNIDSIAFWEASDSTQSLMFVTSKGNASIEVYQYPFTEQIKTISCGEASNGIWMDQERDVLYITERNSSNVCAFDLPGVEANSSLSFTTPATEDDSEPNLAMLNLSDGQKRIYVSYDERVYYYDARAGSHLGEFEPREGLETMYGDDYYQVIYIPDEADRSGVYTYDPDGNLVDSKFGDRSIFDSDAEGIWVYRCLSNDTTDTGEGLIIVADQKDELTDFEVFHRKTKTHLGTLNISGVNNTDGISITQQASPEYPLGLFAVIDDDTSTVGVGWDTILEKTELSCGD